MRREGIGTVAGVLEREDGLRMRGKKGRHEMARRSRGTRCMALTRRERAVAAVKEVVVFRHRPERPKGCDSQTYPILMYVLITSTRKRPPSLNLPTTVFPPCLRSLARYYAACLKRTPRRPVVPLESFLPRHRSRHTSFLPTAQYRSGFPKFKRNTHNNSVRP